MTRANPIRRKNTAKQLKLTTKIPLNFFEVTDSAAGALMLLALSCDGNVTVDCGLVLNIYCGISAIIFSI